MTRPMPDNDPAVSRALHSLATWHPSVVSLVHAADRAEPMADGYGDGILGTRPGERYGRLAARLLRPLNLLIIGLLGILFACGQSTPPIPVSIGEICAQDANTNVTAQGYLSLPVSALICSDGQCKITFYDTSGSVPTEFVVSQASNPGKLTLPPEQYTGDDLEVTLADGSLADRTTLVQITGPVRKQGTNCYLEAYVTEAP